MTFFAVDGCRGARLVICGRNSRWFLLASRMNGNFGLGWMGGCMAFIIRYGVEMMVKNWICEWLDCFGLENHWSDNSFDRIETILAIVNGIFFGLKE